MGSLVSGEGMVVAQLWTIAPIELDQLCDVLGQTLGIGPFQHDSENVWAWGYAHVEDDHLEVNVARKHEDFEPLLEDPIHVMLLVPGNAGQHREEEIRETWLPRVGQALANATGVSAYSGQWHYLRSDNFEYDVEREFTPAQGAA